LDHGSSKHYERWHARFTDAGYAVLALDYRGFGESESERGWSNPESQLQDIRNGYLPGDAGRA
jgi:alpha-beta hydrolase superfamily lysophospholipase